MTFMFQAVEAISNSAMLIAVGAYVAALVCLITVEVHPRGRLGRVAAVSSIALALTGGTAWSYAALYERSRFPEVAAHQPAATDSNEPVRYRGRGGGREVDPEDETDNGRNGGEGRSASRGTSGTSGSGSSGPISLSQALGLAGRSWRSDSSDGRGAIVDCDGCPPMVMVPAGTALIGASGDDALATAAERPQTQVKFWPGYLISIEPVDAASFEAYMSETRSRIWSCGARTAALASPNSIVPSRGFAGCVMPGDADGYAAWLSSRTGKSFRVPTAAEWEYAARTLPVDQMVRGETAEITADCWHTQIPPQGRERIAARTAALDCDSRTVMGVLPTETSGKPRLSARSKLGARETRADIGFRVMRSIDRGR